MVYHSKKDWWLVGAVLVAIVVPLAPGVLFMLLGIPYRRTGLTLLASGTVTGAMVLLLTYPLYYQITSSELIVRCGMLMHRHIPLSSINEVRPDRNPASAPAWSLDRLRIDYRKDGKQASIMISPADRVVFMQEIARTATGLKMEGNCLVRESRPS